MIGGTSSTVPKSSCYWVSKKYESTKTRPTCICMGTGRFLRSVWVPILVAAHDWSPPVFLQTRGTSFVNYMIDREAKSGHPSYEVDVVLSDGTVRTEWIPCLAVFSLGYDRPSVESLMWPLFRCSGVQMIAVGVTEAGLISHATSAMQDLYHLLARICQYQLFDVAQKICIVNTDNVPNNGSTIERHMRTIATSSTEDTVTMLQFFENHVVFLNSMVDRITSSRPCDSIVPRTEPIPAKAFVVLDQVNDLPSHIRALATPKNPLGLVIRTSRKQYAIDLALKLRIANGTHTAIAHLMALCQYSQTDFLAKSVEAKDAALTSPCGNHDTAQLFMKFLDELVCDQILPGVRAHAGDSDTTVESDAIAVWEDWRSRLVHPFFGLSTFFITQNGAAKGGLRLSPTVKDLIAISPEESTHPISSTMAFAFAALLRWLTPVDADLADIPENGVYIGWLDGFDRTQVGSLAASIQIAATSESTVTYADGLRYNLEEGWYEFRCACRVDVHSTASLPAATKSVAEWLGALGNPQQSALTIHIIQAYMLAPSGGDLGSVAHANQLEVLIEAVANLYSRMVAGEGIINLLHGLQLNTQFKTL
jgi:hypothetical protein